MKRTTAPGSVSGLHVDRVAGVTAGSKGNAEDRNNWQEEICHPIEDAGATLDGSDQYQLEKSIISMSNRIGRFVFEDSEIVPVAYSAARSTAHPTYPEYNPVIPRYDANHDVSTSQVSAEVVNHFRAIKGSYKGVSDFTVTVSGSTVTFPATAASVALLTAIQNDALVAGFLNNANAASFVADYETAATQQVINISGVDYVVAAVTPASHQAVVTGSPTAGTACVYPYRIAGSTTSFRLPKLAGFVPAAGGDADGQYTTNKRCMDRFEPHVHTPSTGAFMLNSGGGGFSAGSSSGNVTASTAGPIGDGTNLLRTGKTTDPRAFATFIGTFVRTLIATNWTSA